MKKITLLITILFVFTGVCVAQVKNGNNGSITTNQQSISTTSVEATASVNIYRGLSITNIKGINFGKVAAGVGDVSITSNTQQAAEFQVTGEPNSGVKVTIPNTSVILTSGKNRLSMSIFKPIYNTVDNQKTASESASNDFFGASLGSQGNLYMWVGGKVNVLSNVPSGTYTGTVNVSVTYTGQ